MELKKNKHNTLFWVFLKNFIFLSLCILIEIFVSISLFSIGLYQGFIWPANYSENYFVKNESRIAQSEPFDKSLIPHTCQYGLFDFKGNYLEGNLGNAVIKDAKDNLKDNNLSGRYFYKIKRDTGYCMVFYDISSHFSWPVLHRIIPNLELTMLLLFILIFLIIIISNALRFGKKLKKELEPLLEEIMEIKNRDLSLEQKASKIKEFNDILYSLYDMKIALSDSLKKEWETEQRRKANISALAHDIKTPLTIIKGNAELIKEEDNVLEIYELAETINGNSDKIERYIKLLIDETKNNSSLELPDAINLSSLVADIIMQSENMCKAKNIELIVHNTDTDVNVTVHKELLQRGIMNIIKNAIEHTDMKKGIKIEFNYKDSKFIVLVEDFGNGFTEEALKYAKEQFYTEKTERSEEHYGLGMYIANSVAEKYKGGLTFYNKPDKLGAVVKFEIRLDYKNES